MRDTNLINALREHAEWAEGNQKEYHRKEYENG
jgi:hypothetical protein